MGSGVVGGVILCSGTNFDDDKKMADYHLAAALAERVPVLFVDPPISLLTPLKNRAAMAALRRPRLRQVGERFHCLTTVAPPKPQADRVVGVTERLVRRAIRDAVQELGWAPLALISTWHLIDVYDAAPHATSVYWWLDDPASGAEFWGYDRDRLVAGDQRNRRRADITLAVSQVVVDEITVTGGRAVFFPNGCDAETMARTGLDPLAGDVDLAAPIAGFVGHLNSRTDLALLEAVADAGISLLLVGPRVDDFEPDRLDALCARPNVHWAGIQPFERLPAYQGHLRVGLVPYADSAFNRASFPLKPLEYLAAGLPVVSTSLPGVRWLRSPDITFADEPGSFAQAVRTAAELPLDTGAVERRRESARRHTWRSRADEFLDLLPGRTGALASS